MDDAKAIETLTHEMQLGRSEMAALTDALARNHHTMQTLTVATNRLADMMEEALSRRGFWSKLLG